MTSLWTFFFLIAIKRVQNDILMKSFMAKCDSLKSLVFSPIKKAFGIKWKAFSYWHKLQSFFLYYHKKCTENQNALQYNENFYPDFYQLKSWKIILILVASVGSTKFSMRCHLSTCKCPVALLKLTFSNDKKNDHQVFLGSPITSKCVVPVNPLCTKCKVKFLWLLFAYLISMYNDIGLDT